MKILHCIPTLGTGGAERQLSYLSPELARRGHEVHVAYLNGGINLRRLGAGNVFLHLTMASSNYDPRILLSLFRLVRKIRPDLIQTWILQMDLLGGLVAKKYKIPWIIREPTSKEGWPRITKNNFRRWLGLKADAIIANSLNGEEYWQSCGFRGPRFVIPNALPLDEIEQITPYNPEVGEENLHKIILFAGRLEDRPKNVQKLVRALLLLPQESPFRAYLCGDGPERSSLAALVREHGLEKQILLPGVIANVWALMKRANVFVSVSHFEGRPNAVIEAMACGCPLVVSDIPAHREFLNERSSLLVNPLDVRAIARGIREVLEAPEEARARARIAKEKVADWTVPAIARQYEEAYREVVRQHNKRLGKA